MSSRGVLCLLLLQLAACQHGPREICDDTLYSEGRDTFDLGANERALVCRDPENPSWQDIPLAQREYHVKVFLHKRGYFDPKLRVEGDRLYVDRGAPLRVSRLDVVGAPEDMDAGRLRRVVREPLTSDLLDRVEGMLLAWLKNGGYACAEVELKAFEEDGRILAAIEPGEKVVFPPVVVPDDVGLFREALQRFDAFKEGQTYDQRLLRLTSTRLESDGIVVNSIFTTKCGDGGIEVIHRATPGRNRLISLGVGASTEELPIVQARWKTLRLGKMGSSIATSLYASLRRQTLQATMEWYFSRSLPRFFLAPEATLERRDENKFTSFETQFYAPLAASHEIEEGRFTAKAGPAITKSWTFDTQRRNVLTFLSLDTLESYKTHEYELYQGDPRTGFEVRLFTRSMAYSFPHDVRAHLFRLSGTHLWNVRRFEPPLFILATRYVLATTVTNQRPVEGTQLPASYFHYLGGDRDLRGFGRNELPRNDAGALTVAALGLEARLAKTLPVGLEPFVFTDWGGAGLDDFEFDPALYFSPGVGMRWQTPFGAVRATLAHGFVYSREDFDPELEHLQFFISFGQEF